MTVPYAVFCGREGEGYIIDECYTASLVTRVTDAAATIYEDRSRRFFLFFFFFPFTRVLLITANLAVNYSRSGPSSLPSFRQPSVARLSIQHRATYAFVRCIFMRLIIFFRFPRSSLSCPPSPPFIELRLSPGRIMDSRLTRLPRSLPSSEIRNKSGPRVLRAIASPLQLSFLRS